MSRPPRIAGFSYRGCQRYFLTFCTFQRRSTIQNQDVVALTLAQFRATAEAESFAILAYCVMPDHVHLLVEALIDQADLYRFAKLAKQRSGGKFARITGKRLWQEGYFDRVLRQDEDVKKIARLYH